MHEEAEGNAAHREKGEAGEKRLTFLIGRFPLYRAVPVSDCPSLVYGKNRRNDRTRG